MAEPPATRRFRSLSPAVSVLVLGLLLATSVRADPVMPTTVGVDLTLLSEESYRRLDGLGLERTCLLRLVQEGFAVLSVARAPRVRIVVNDLEDVVSLHAIGPTITLTREVRYQEGSAGSELHLEVAQKLVELARLASRETAPVVPVVPAVAETPPPVPASSSLPMPIQPSAGVDAMVRLQGLDLAVRIGLVVAPAKGLGMAVTSSLCPSQGLGLRVFEWQLQAGALYRYPVSERIELSAALVAGALVHDYALADPTALSPTGTVVDLLTSTPLALLWNTMSGLRLGARLAPGLSSSSRQHLRTTQSGTQILWQRGALRVEAGLVAGWEFP